MTRLVIVSPYPDTAQTKRHTLFKDPIHVTEIDAKNKQDQKEKHSQVGDHSKTFGHDRTSRLVIVAIPGD